MRPHAHEAAAARHADHGKDEERTEEHSNPREDPPEAPHWSHPWPPHGAPPNRCCAMPRPQFEAPKPDGPMSAFGLHYWELGSRGFTPQRKYAHAAVGLLCPTWGMSAPRGLL